ALVRGRCRILVPLAGGGIVLPAVTCLDGGGKRCQGNGEGDGRQGLGTVAGWMVHGGFSVVVLAPGGIAGRGSPCTTHEGCAPELTDRPFRRGGAVRRA